MLVWSRPPINLACTLSVQVLQDTSVPSCLTNKLPEIPDVLPFEEGKEADQDFRCRARIAERCMAEIIGQFDCKPFTQRVERMIRGCSEDDRGKQYGV